MSELALEYGYVGLFVLAFAASTLIAAPADVVAMGMPQVGFDPWIVGIVAVVGGTLGNTVNYAVGRYGAVYALRWFADGEEEGSRAARWRDRAQHLFDRYGAVALLFSGMPFIGDPITTVAGAARMNFWIFLVMVVIGKSIKLFVLLGGMEVVVRLFQ